MKKVFIGLLLVLLFLSFHKIVYSQRYAACDLCGYCPPDNPPDSWTSCAKCLYNTDGNPTDKQTLLIDPTTNLPPTPYPGHQYTMIGCITTNGFQQEGAAASVVQVILNIIFSIVGGIAFIYLIYGSFIVATSQSDPEKLNYGKRLIGGAIIGLIFTLASAFIVNIITSGVLKIPGF